MLYSLPSIIDSVLILLALMSIVVWGVVIHKLISFYKLNQRNTVFLEEFRLAEDLYQVRTKTKLTDGSLARICQAGLDEWKRLRLGVHPVSATDRKELVTAVLKQQAHIEQARIEKGLAILASIGSTAPFIGLFGTVWGIMHALKDISSKGSAGLDVVAGPIGEALIATGIGIATAVPAVLAYNYFLRQLKSSNAQIENFGIAFQYLAIKSGLGSDIGTSSDRRTSAGAA
ncbi:MAG: flagellar motor protein MotA [Methylotenera sp.]|uniref:MotA/TolQ/ExbB proton channel family protein n=1 Tax=Methylotenera sp. TaxID=2051956 RepID=UPI000D4DE4D5|nr:MotA/TolQ/ExbB proton channel family protein [Methylotenera sp.]PPC80319.1 MAG: flagellar motor protein MotA [Methylotenera sp.]PPC94382.1 MAG: flagellar motor protein MotA [Methylotenera sp.]